MTGGADNQSIGLGLTIATDRLNGMEGKINEDRYEIFVNNDFVGYKTLLNRNDTLKDVDDFLRHQGLDNFKTELIGDHYYINADDRRRAKEILSIYCQNR